MGNYLSYDNDEDQTNDGAKFMEGMKKLKEDDQKDMLDFKNLGVEELPYDILVFFVLQTFVCCSYRVRPWKLKDLYGYFKIDRSRRIFLLFRSFSDVSIFHDILPLNPLYVSFNTGSVNQSFTSNLPLEKLERILSPTLHSLERLELKNTEVEFVLPLIAKKCERLEVLSVIFKGFDFSENKIYKEVKEIRTIRKIQFGLIGTNICDSFLGFDIFPKLKNLKSYHSRLSANLRDQIPVTLLRLGTSVRNSETSVYHWNYYEFCDRLRIKQEKKEEERKGMKK